jgi:hypothetical protein
MLNGWWGVQRSLVDPKIGGVYTLAWKISESGFGFVSTGRIEKFIPGNCLIIGNLVYLNPERPILGPMQLELTVRQAGKNTALTICQDGYQDGLDWDWYYEAVLQAWPQAAQTLKTYLESTV